MAIIPEGYEDSVITRNAKPFMDGVDDAIISGLAFYGASVCGGRHGKAQRKNRDTPSYRDAFTCAADCGMHGPSPLRSTFVSAFLSALMEG